MSMRPSTCTRLLYIDAGGPLARALVARLEASGWYVVTHTRSATAHSIPGAAVHVVAEQVSKHFDAWNCAHGPFTHVLFGMSDVDEFVLGLESGQANLADAIQGQLTAFLAELRGISLALARAGGRQIWVLTQEDSMAFCMQMATQPIITGARHAAVKSLAREVRRFGLQLNCATIQLLAEQAPASAWRDARELLKAFSLKFVPLEAATVASTLAGLLDQDTLPFSGQIVPFGIGVPEANV